ncbi:MAG TPA: putative peptide modification system cyclase [Rudaea sp.]
MSAVPVDQGLVRTGTMASPQLRTLALCDLVESTALIEELGDQRGAELMRRLDRVTRDLLHRHGGREIDKTDGFLVLFDRPIRAVAFALDYQRALHDLGRAEFLPLRARIGIHVGDVMLWENEPADVAQGAKPLEVEGLIKPVAARLMTLARPGQILLSGVAHSLALRAQGELDAEYGKPAWKAHGNYRFKGVADPVAVYEVGQVGIAPLRAPSWSSKAHREVPWYRRPAMMVVEALVVAAAISVPAYTFFRSPPAIAFAKRDWVVVGDFKNLTGESVFDGSLQTAFRIGLEQSRYVNLLSDLKVRDTLKMMERDPEHTSVDRSIGSEIAIREGARAVILPMIAEIGGHVRVTAEVIDPKTQTTVYSESVDGLGAESVLPSIDNVNKRLRLRLGEALATVSGDSLPLEKVATKNLDALRAYSLGQKAYAAGDMTEAVGHYEQALKLDPEFAMAHIAIARVRLNAGENSAALREITAASKLRDRLSARDQLFVDAWETSLQNPEQALDKWKLLTGLYPDFYPAQGAYANAAWTTNRYDTAIAAAKINASQHNANAATGEYLLGIAYLSTDRYQDAEQQFTAAARAGYAPKGYPALLYAIRHDLAQASAVLNEGKPAPACSAETEHILFCVDQGELPSAIAYLDKAAGGPASTPIKADHTKGIALSLRSLVGNNNADLDNYFKAEGSAGTADNALDRQELRFHQLFAAYLLLRNGAKAAPNSALDAVLSDNSRTDPAMANLRAIARAERERADNAPERAIGLLKPMLDGNELYLTHLVLLDAYAAQGADDDALREALWLSVNRGRAYAEFGEHQLLAAYNVAQSDLALLRAAEISQHAGHRDDARRRLAQFQEIWRGAPTIASLATRIATLKTALE